ncbi:MAG: hypothetical protein H6741_02935 [Alphaproteobacteria bacterium]|nr:hypothetical protein [Alphaproteobacteria bacterium]
MLLLALSLLGSPVAEAGALYINGVRADGVTGLDLKDVNIRIDANGDMWIDAPRYQVEVVQPGGPQGAATQPSPATQPAYGSQPATQPAYGSQPATQPAYGSQPATQPAYGSQPATQPAQGTVQPAYGGQASAPAPTASAGLPPGSWWLVSDDNSSTGHVVDVYIGGVLVHTIKSGDAQVLMDVSRFLRPGVNQVQFTARAGGQPGGGLLHIYVGKGDTIDGVLNLDSPEIEFTRRSSDDPRGASRQYQIDIR